MIQKITRSDLIECLEIFHRGYETVAVEFGLTTDNCPHRGRASLPYDALVSEYEHNTLMFGYYLDQKMVGYLGFKVDEKGDCKLNDIIVLPEYRQNGFGKEMLVFCKAKARELGANKITLGMIDDNQVLKNWYMENGFITIGYKKFEKAPFTVGFMEYSFV